MVDGGSPESDPDLRRRAAWLLGLLAVVAVLFVVVMTQVLGNGSGNSHSNGLPGALDSAVAQQSRAASTPATKPSSHPRPAPAKTSSSSSAPAHHSLKCPTHQTCVLDGDVGNGIAAINAYRTQNGQPAVTGKVSPAAQKCAVNNGNGCSGGWAETEVAKPKGDAAVQKILPFGHLLDPNLKNFEIGWAYDPGAQLYYFAIIRND